MPAVIEQINNMTLSDKMYIMDYLVKTVAMVVEKQETLQEKSAVRHDFSRFSRRWSQEEGALFDAVTARTIDEDAWA